MLSEGESGDVKWGAGNAGGCKRKRKIHHAIVNTKEYHDGAEVGGGWTGAR